LLGLHSSHELGSTRLAELGRELARHAVHVGRHLLRNTTTATLLRVARELTGTATLNTGHSHARLRERNATTALRHEAGLLARSKVNRGLHVLLGHTGGGGGLLHTELVASLDTSLKLALSNILALGQSDVQRLVVNHTLVHLSDSLGSIVGVTEADESEALTLTKLLVRLLLSLLVICSLLSLLGLVISLLLGLLLVLFVLVILSLLLLVLITLSGGLTHHLGGGNRAELGEHLAELIIVNIVIEVLDVEVNALVLVGLLQASSLIRLAELLLAFVLLLGAANVQILAMEILAVEVVNSLGGSLVSSEVDKTETSALALLITGEGRRGDVTKLLKELTEIILGNVRRNVLDVDVSEVGLHLLELALAVLLGDVVADINLLLVEKHAVDVLDGLGGSLISLVVNETIALGVTILVLGDLAAQNVTKSSKGVVESLVVNSDIKVLDENIALAVLAKSRVTLRPHDAAGATLDQGVVELLKSLLAISSSIVVDIGITKGAAGDGVTADTDRGDSANLGEELKEHSLSDGGVKLADVERSRVLGVRSSGSGGRSSSIVSGGSDAGVDNRSLGITAVERGVVEVVGELVNSAGSSVGGHCEYRFSRVEYTCNEQ
jgi:hypothetical protein